MSRSDPETLMRLALLTLEQALHASEQGVVERTWGIRFALAYVHSMGMAKREDCEEFWRELVAEHSSQHSDAVRNVVRGSNCNGCLESIYRSAGVQRSPDMMFRGRGLKRRPTTSPAR